MRHILIVHYHFLPVHNVSVRRLVGYAKELSVLGWHVSVLTRDWNGVHEADPSWGLSWEPHLESDSHCTIHRVASPPVVSYPVRGNAFAGRLAAFVPRYQRVQRTAERFMRRVSSIGRFVTGRYPDEFSGWVRPAVAAGERLFARSSVDVVMSYCPPESNHVVARQLARRLDVPWVPFFGDMYGFLIPDRAASVRVLFRRAWYRRCLSTASASIGVSPAMVEFLARAYGKPSHIIHTGYDPEEYQSREPAPTSNDGRLTISHVGSVYPGDQKPEIFFDGLDLFLSQCPEAVGRLQVRFVGSKCERQLEDLIRGRPASQVCVIERKVDSATAVSIVRSSDILLAFTCTRNREKHGTLSYPTKVFEAFGARRPILSVPCDDDWVDALLDQTGGGISARDEADVAGRLMEWFRVWVRDGYVPYGGRTDELEKFTRARQAERLDAVLRSVADAWLPASVHAQPTVKEASQLPNG